MSLFSNIFKKTNKENAVDFPVDTEGKFRNPIGNGYFYISDEVSNGYGGYCRINMYLLNENDKSFCLKILDKNGKIVNFPGLTGGDWEKQLEIKTDSRANFNFSLYIKNDLISVCWTLQPDGRYFEDEDGFGSENCIELTAYSTMTFNGKYLSPFTVKCS